MSRNDFKEGFGVVDHTGLRVRTISDARRGAIVNWLYTYGDVFVNNAYTDEQINALWDAKRGEAKVVSLRIYIQE